MTLIQKLSKTIFSLTLLLIILATSQPQLITAQVISNPIRLGVFDVNNRVDSQVQNKFKLETRFRPWNDSNLISKDIAEINKLGRQTVMTAEPWPIFNEKKGQDMFWNILTGRYDNTIKNMCQTLKQANGDVYLRWGHEMDMVGLYFWSTTDAELFIYTYRYVIKNCRKEFGSEQSRLKSLWSPGGRDILRYYYPGGDVVDYTGFSMFSYPAFEQYNIKRTLVFEDLIYDRYPKFVQYGKPIIAAEFGIAGTLEEKNNIVNRISSLSNLKNEFPMLDTIMFFQDTGDSWVPGVVQAPDFRLNTEQFSRIK
jgi:beta-mannanase